VHQLKINDWLVILFFIVILAFVIAYSAIIIALLIAESSKRNLKKKIIKALETDDLTIDDLRNVQSTLGLSDHQTLSVLTKLKSDIDCNVLNNKSTVKPKLDKLINNFKLQEPYSGLPESLRDSMVIARTTSNDPDVIDKLADKIQVSVKKQSRSDLWLKVATYLGLIIGLVGTIWGFAK